MALKTPRTDLYSEQLRYSFENLLLQFAGEKKSEDNLLDHKSRRSSVRAAIRFWLLVTRWGLTLDVIQLLLSVVFLVVWVWSTYYDSTPSWIYFMDISLAIFFVLYWLLGLYLAEKRLVYVLSFTSLIDALSIIPAFIPYNLSDSVWMRLLKGLSTLRIFRLHRILSFPFSELHQKIISIPLSVVCIVFVFSGLVLAVEGPYNSSVQYFHSAVYFVVVTATTVGFGDITPSTELGRVLVIALIITTFVFLPLKTSDLISLLSQISVYDGSFKRGQKLHCVITGYIPSFKLIVFVNEFFAESWVRAAIELVALGKDKPDAATKAFIRDCQTQSKTISYFCGTALIERDLKRVRADKARALFVLSNPYPPNPEEEDKFAILQAIAVKKFNPKLEVFVQILNPNNKFQLQKAGVDHVICLNEIKLNLMACNTLFTGVSTMILDLLTVTEYTPKMFHEQWHEEYGWGKEQEIYRCRLPRCFWGKRFDECAEALYYEYNVIAFALRRETMEQKTIHLFPYFLPVEKDDVIFIIASNSSVCNEIIKITEFPEYSKKEIERGVDDEDKDILASLTLQTEENLPYKASFIGFRSLEQPSKLSTVDGSISSDIHLEPTYLAQPRDERSSFEERDSSFDSYTHPVEHSTKKRESEESIRRQILKGSSSARLSLELQEIGRESLYQELQSKKKTKKKQKMATKDEDKEKKEKIFSESKESDNQQQKESIMTPQEKQTEEEEKKTIDSKSQTWGHSSTRPSNVWDYYNLYKSPIPWESVIMEDIKRDEHINQHIIICTSTLDSLFYIIAPLRYKILPKIQQIVILLSSIPQDFRQKWSQISLFPEVYIVIGSPLNILDMKRAGIEKASKIVVLKNVPASGISPEKHLEIVSSDIECVLTYFTLTENTQALYTIPIFELANHENARYFTSAYDDRKLSKKEKRAVREFAPPFAAGRVFVDSILENLTAVTFFNPDIVHIVKLMVSYEKNTPYALCKIDIPNKFLTKMKKKERKFSELFSYLIRKKFCLPLALYRASGFKGSSESYVYTNPKTDAILREEDKVFVLCKKSKFTSFVKNFPGKPFDPEGSVQRRNREKVSNRKRHRQRHPQSQPMKDTTEKEIPQSQSSHEHTEQIRELQEKMDKILQLLAEITQNKLSKELQQNQSETK